MLYSLFQSGFSRDMLVAALLSLPVILLALTIHELAHGYAAYKLGDQTAYQYGRLTLNPAKHLDPAGTIMMLVFGFGWAKPVPVNTRYFRKPRRDMAITALAGPISNCLLCLLGYFAFRLTASSVFPEASALFRDTFYAENMAWYVVNYALAVQGGVKAILLLFFYYFFYLNATLAVFNLIPIPPLDGSRILSAVLPPRLYYKLMQYERYLVLVIIVALFTGFLDTPLSYATGGLVWLCEQAIGWLPFL